MRFQLYIAACVAALAAPTTVVAQQADPAAAAAEAIDKVDVDKLFSEKEYARATLATLERLRSGVTDPRQLHSIDVLRAIGLRALDRRPEALVILDRLHGADPNNPFLHYLALVMTADSDPARSIAYLERADRTLTDPGARREFRGFLDDDLAFSIRGSVHASDNQSLIQRSAAALLALGWPNEQDIGLRDGLTVDLIDAAIARGDIKRATELAGTIRTIDSTLQLLVDRSYAGVAWNGDPIAQIRRAIAAEDDHSGRSLVANPDDPKALLRRMQYLRSVGRDGDALLLVENRLNGFVDSEKPNEHEFWVVNEAAFALAAVGRPGEAVTLINRLLALPMDKYPDLISMSINAIDVMMQAGKFDVAAAHAETLAADPKFASPFGKMWIWQGVACAHYTAGRPEKATPWLARLKAGEKDNEAALSRALLCANDLDAAAALIVRRLQGPDSESVVAAIQDYQFVGKGAARRNELEPRWAAVLARPEVQAAVGKAGRILKLPLARAYYGLF